MCKREYPCDGELAICPYEGNSNISCRDLCGLGVYEENYEEFESEEE